MFARMQIKEEEEQEKTSIENGTWRAETKGTPETGKNDVELLGKGKGGEARVTRLESNNKLGT